MDRGEVLLEAALSLIGSKFRLHGRDPATGLDCVGVVECALRSVGETVVLSQAYGLRQRDISRYLPVAEANGLRLCNGPPEPGDVLLFNVGALQNHLAVSDGAGGLVHAHAGLLRVVHGTSDPDWQLLRQWRIRPH